jgi:hypothetical protein
MDIFAAENKKKVVEDTGSRHDTLWLCPIRDLIMDHGA